MDSFSVEFDDYAMDVLRKGAGQPLLLIHGSVSEARTWKRHIDILSGSYDVVAPTLRYFGSQPWPDDGAEFGSERHALDVIDLIEKLNLKDVLCFGWSYGGNVALHSAVLNPALFRNLFLYEPAAASLLDDESARALATTDRIAMFTRAAQLLSSGDDPKSVVKTFLDDAVGKKGAFQMMPEYYRRISVENASMLSLLFNMTPAQINLDNFDVPTVLARGNETRDFYKVTADGLEQQCSNIDVKCIPKADHLWPILHIEAFCSMLSESAV